MNDSSSSGKFLLRERRARNTAASPSKIAPPTAPMEMPTIWPVPRTGDEASSSAPDVSVGSGIVDAVAIVVDEVVSDDDSVVDGAEVVVELSNDAVGFDVVITTGMVDREPVACLLDVEVIISDEVVGPGRVVLVFEVTSGVGMTIDPVPEEGTTTVTDNWPCVLLNAFGTRIHIS